MVAYNKFSVFTQDLDTGKHVWASDTFKVMLTNTAPVASNTVKANITEIAAGNGYSAGGTATTTARSNSSGTDTVTGTQVVFTASGGDIGPFEYFVLYNDTQTSPAKPLVAWWDYGSALTLHSGDSLTIKFNAATPGTIYTLV